MYIYWLGESSFKIKTEQSTIIIDPASKKTGLSQSTLEGDLILISGSLDVDENRVGGTKQSEEPFIINDPGEYETQGVFVYATAGKNNNTLYFIKADGLHIAHLGGLNEPLTDEELKLFEGADILMIPVGGNGLLAGKQADQIVSEVEPRIIIPMNYALPKLTAQRDSIDSFLKEMGAQDQKAETSLYVTKQKLHQEETRLIVLQA